MYKRGRGSFYKHLDFLCADIVVLQLAFMVSYSIRHGIVWIYASEIYRQMSIVLLLAQMCVVVIQKSYKGIIRRDTLGELVQILKYTTYIIMIAFAYMFVGKISALFSRTVFLLTWGLAVILLAIERSVLKMVVRQRILQNPNVRSILIAGEEENVRKLLHKNRQNKYKDYGICGVIITDSDLEGQEVESVPVVGYVDISRDFLLNTVVDEVMLCYNTQTENIKNIIDTCMNMGLTIHKVIAQDPPMSQRTVVEELMGCTVLTTSINMASARHLFIKRLMDIAGGLAGVLVTAVLTVLIGPVIYIKSPGPVFFSQERVGKNGRKFRIYKFRSMYLDAEERKKELMSQNEMQGLMFKMENDPRIIKGIGHFIRSTSLDEFPQFWNVLRGDMSLVGTRPPTVEEYEQYDEHHRKRLTINPGLTGMWQVSGRSDIVDFEEVVALDTKYITEWSIGLDIKILIKTIGVVLKSSGAR